MDVVTNCIEIKKHFTINNFSGYTHVDDKILQTFNLTADSFHSEWEISVYPMHSSNSIDQKSIHCDIYIELVCLFSSAPSASVKTIKIASLIKGRENYPKLFDLNQEYEEKPTWKCAVISRITLETLKIKKDVLEFYIQFNILQELLLKSEDSRNTIVKDIEVILTHPQYYDTCLMSSSDSKFYVHSSILHARSNIMKSGKIICLSYQHKQNEDSIQTLEENFFQPKTDGQDRKSLSNESEDSVSSGSTCRTPLFTVASTLSSPRKSISIKTPNSPMFSPRNKSSGTPRKSLKLPVTPKKSCDSPKYSNQTQLTHYFPRSSSLNTNSDNITGTPFNYLSPIKKETSSSFINRSPLTIRSKENGLGTPYKLNVPPSPISTLHSNIRSPCGTVPKQSIQNLKRKLFDHQSEDSKTMTIIKLNMSTSVLQELLVWLYSGKSSRIAELAQPLMVAALRHNVSDLSRTTQFYLTSTLSVNNVSGLLLLSHRYEAVILKEEAMEFAASHAGAVTVSTSWADLAMRYPDILLEFTKRLAARKS